MWTVNRQVKSGEREVVMTFDNDDEWMAWCQNFAIRKHDSQGRAADLCVDDTGGAWIQVGYVMLPAGEVS